ncbi:SDR family oxidoreductase [Halobacterium sp. KA-6]|uniref:SDR family oxidoreductase n=1 Tax=Halobacterium sp. KA-6 TaxID=2896368 RepID=UPI001E363EE7|nr:NAD(P)H-binding protein [Halobacterium sp. KA-6]MCD2204499.1 NAD(P)H-binding protein [Halobacterium sp. KA-6]
MTGATGTLGTALRPRLTAADHTVPAASRSPPNEAKGSVNWVELDVTDGSNIKSALENIDVVIHAATAPQGDTAAVDVQGTKRLIEAAEVAGVEHFVYPSIVGIDDIPYSYYEHKAIAETAVAKSDIPTTIIRSTQFHAFIAELLDFVAKLPVWPLPTKLQLQPIDVGEVADIIVEHATLTASGRTDPIGGPEVRSVRELARAYRAARNLRRPILHVPLPGDTVAAFRAGDATCPDHRGGVLTWEEWLAQRYVTGPNETTTQMESSM